MKEGVFITGTDTGCGKTEITLGLMHRLQQTGRSVLGMKPVAAGATETHQGLCNYDALRIQQQGSLEIPYRQVNPFVYTAPIAPHLAAVEAGRRIRLPQIKQTFDEIAAMADMVIVEGAGGWRVPLGDDVGVPQLVQKLDLPVIMVVGMKLGCLNHAILTAEGIIQSGCTLIGWVANHIDPAMAYREQNVRTLGQWIPYPCLGEVPYLHSPSPEQVSGYLKHNVINLGD